MDTSLVIIFGACIGAILASISSLNWRHSLRAALVLVLLEGAIRKWVLPGASDLVYFAKDFVLLGCYFGFYRQFEGTSLASLWPDLPVSIIQICGMLIVLSACNPNIGSFLAAILGLRGYMFYLPICFIIPHLFRTRQELLLNLSCYAIIALPICLLGFVQYKSDGFSVINTYAGGLSEYGASTFGVSDRIRITGTFSYLSGHVVFVNTFFALILALISAEKVPFRFILLYVVLPCLVANGYMSGSRASTSTMLFVTVGFVVIAGASMKGLGSLLLAAGVTMVATQIFFADAFQDSMDRMNNIGDTFFQRMWTMPINELSIALEKGGLVGCGTGTTSPAVEGLRSRLEIPQPELHPGYYDGELPQVLAEIGIVGFFAWYSLRLLVIVGLIRSFMSTKDPLLKSLALMAILINIPYLMISLVLNHTASVLVWSATGLGFIPLLVLQQQRMEQRD